MDAVKFPLFNLKDVPSGMEWCIEEGEFRDGQVACPPAVYKIVLALRWILTYVESADGEVVTSTFIDGYSYNTWRVLWKVEGENGYRVSLFLTRDKAEVYDAESGEFHVAQENSWLKLATIECEGDNREVVRYVSMPALPPYGEGVSFDGRTGVRRLLDEAAAASWATSSYGSSTSRYGARSEVYRSREGVELYYTLEGNDYQLKNLSLKVVKAHW